VGPALGQPINFLTVQQGISAPTQKQSNKGISAPQEKQSATGVSIPLYYRKTSGSAHCGRKGDRTATLIFALLRQLCKAIPKADTLNF